MNSETLRIPVLDHPTTKCGKSEAPNEEIGNAIVTPTAKGLAALEKYRAKVTPKLSHFPSLQEAIVAKEDCPANCDCSCVGNQCPLFSRSKPTFDKDENGARFLKHVYLYCEHGDSRNGGLLGRVDQPHLDILKVQQINRVDPDDEVLPPEPEPQPRSIDIPEVYNELISRLNDIALRVAMLHIKYGDGHPDVLMDVLVGLHEQTGKLRSRLAWLDQQREEGS